MAARITIELEHSEALVLWDVLLRVDNGWIANASKNGMAELRITDMAEMMALWQVKAQLDLQLVEMFDPSYSALLASAQRDLRDKAGGWPSEQ